MNRKNIFFLGDSIFRRGFLEETGFACLLEIALKDEARLINSGVDGDKIYDLLIRCDKDIPPVNPDIIVINTGTNDVGHKFTKNTGTDESKYIRYLDMLLTKLKQITPDIIVCSAAVDGENIGDNTPRNVMLNAYTEHAAIQCRKHGLVFCDVRRCFKEYLSIHNRDHRDQGILTEDQGHLNMAGNQLYADHLLPLLKSMLGKSG